jgi:hypothetical protein
MTLAEPPEVYYHNNWVDTTDGIYANMYGGGACDEIGKGLIIDKGALQIYGVAAVAITYNDLAIDITDPYWMIPAIYDTSMENMHEYYRLYKKIDTDTLDTVIMDMIAEAKMDIFDSNVVGYFDMKGLYDSNYAKRYLPIRAAYFDEPVEVSDTFFVVMTQYHSNSYKDEYGQIWNHHGAPIDYISISSFNWHNINEINILHYNWLTQRWQIWYTPNQNNNYLLIFPLLDRLPTYASPLVTGGGMAWAPVVTMESFVSVSPNPTTGMATVTSCFGLSGVELYDLGGALLLSQAASGLSYTLDLRPYAAGVYILKVRTPSGTVTKKIVRQ